MGGLVGDAVKGGVEGIVSGIGGVLDELFTSDDERNKAAVAMERIRSSEWVSYLNVLMAEASHASVFVAGARPALMWACVATLVYEGLLRGLLMWVMQVATILFGLPTLPALPSAEPIMWEVVSMACALAGVRGVEKIKGAARSRLK